MGITSALFFGMCQRQPHTPAHAAVRGRRSVAALSTLAAALLNACYQYTPVLQPPSANAQVRVTVTDAGTAALVGAVGPSVESLDGQLLSADSDSLVLAMVQTTNRRGVETDWRGERVAVPRSAVASLGVRRLARSRTVLAVAAGIALLIGGAVGINAGTNSNGGGLRPPPPGQ